MNFEPICSISGINLDIPLLIWELETGDNSGSVFITRLLHNKLVVAGNSYLGCYTSFFSPEVVTSIFGILGLALFIIGIYFLISKRHFKILAILLILPIISITQITTPFINRKVILVALHLFVILFGLHYSVISLKSMLKNKLFGN